jgi:hypothetical protein
MGWAYVGTVRNYRQSKDDGVSLKDLKFFVGDFMDLTISVEQFKN